MRLLRLAIVVTCLAVSACSSQPAPAAARGPSYTCCDANDIERTYQPGQTLTVHWVVDPGEPGAPVRVVELAAHLAGPYRSTADLKAAEFQGGSTPAANLTADTVRPAGVPGERPVSTIAIGPDAEPGYYSLVTSVQDGGTVSGASVIQVVRKA